MRTAIDWAFYTGSPDLEGFQKALRKDRIDAVIQRDGQGRLTGICYIDERNKAVFEGSSLGEQYSASSIERRCERAAEERQKRTVRQSQEQTNKLRIYG